MGGSCKQADSSVSKAQKVSEAQQLTQRTGAIAHQYQGNG